MIKGMNELKLSEIFRSDLGIVFNGQHYKDKGCSLVENTPEEIRDVVLEMVQRLDNTWDPDDDDEALQDKFWNIFPLDSKSRGDGTSMQGEVRARYGANFLRGNIEWLE